MKIFSHMTVKELLKVRNQIWAYISGRYENDGVLVDCDEVYETYQVEFDCGYPSDLIDEIMEGFIGCSDLSGIKIEYEDEILLPLNM